MQSQTSQEQETLRSALDGVRREYHVDPHKMDKHTDSEVEGGLVFMQLEEDGSMRETPKLPKRSEYSFVDHLSSREIYQMPIEDTPRQWNTYIPRFTGASETYRTATPTTPDVPQSTTISAPVEEVTVRTTDEGADVVTTPVTPVRESAPTQIVGTRLEDAPKVSEHPTEDEDFSRLSPQATVVTVSSHTPEESEDVFILPKTLPTREQNESTERTEDDERRDILAAISPLVDAEVTESATEPLADPVAPGEQTESEDTVSSPDAHAFSATEESREDRQAASRVEREDMYYAIPDPVFATPSDSAPVEAIPDYDLPKESISMPDSSRHSAEFTSFTQRLAFKDRFLDLILSVKVRLIAAAVLTLLLFGIALLPEFSINLVESLALYSIPGVLALVDMQGCICLFALAFPEILRAYKDIFKGKVRSEFFLFVSFVFMLVYTVFVVILDPVTYPLFGSIFGILCIVAMVSSLYLHNATFMSFKVVSMPEEKGVVVQTMTRTLTHENFALDGAIDEYKSKIARIFRTTFVGEFFKKNKKISENSIKILTFVCISIACALLSGVICFILKDMKSALYSFMSVLCFSTPVFYILSHKLSYYQAERVGLYDDSTVIGESSFEEYAGIDVVSYEDTEIFGEEDVALRRFKLIGEEKDFTKPLRQMAGLFGAVGGPLSVLFYKALERHPEPSSDVIVESDGIYGTVDGARVLAGSEEFMYRHGIEIPADETAPGLDATPTTKVIYAAEGNRVHAKFYIRYSFSEEFTMLLPSLRKAGITPLIYTRDPNITNELLSALTLGGGSIRVMKKYNLKSEDDPLYDRLDGSIVTMGDKTDVINMILLCKRYRKYTSQTENLLSIASLSGIALGAAISFFLSPTLPVWVYALWHGAWLAVSVIMSRSTFRMPKEENTEQRPKT